MHKIAANCDPVNAQEELRAILAEAATSVQERLELAVSQLLTAMVSHTLQRTPHRRRDGLGEHEHCSSRCCRCGSTRRRHFSRNGYRERHVLSQWGELRLSLPRVRCQCGGSVALDFGGILQPYQRLWADVTGQIQRWGELTLSLRQMRQELQRSRIGPLALRTLQRRLQQLATPTGTAGNAAAVPPVLQLDAVWITLLRPNGQLRRDRKGRLRAVVGRFRCPVLIAMGVWPASDRAEILAWQLGDSESDTEWTAFLAMLEAQGFCGKQGVQLIIHDGGSGLCAALDMVYFGAAEQRCLFHKLRNISQAIQLPDSLTPRQRQRRRNAILKDFRAIWQAQRYATVLRRYLQVVRTYRASQPRAVATLRRDFRSTISFLHIAQRFPFWQRCHLRTTSRLERFNRCIRRRARAANAFHSVAGLLNAVTQEAALFNAA